MQVYVRYFGVFRTQLNVKEEKITLEENATLKRLLEELVKIHGASIRRILESDSKTNLDPSVVITINGSMPSQGLETNLKEGDKIAFMTIISGG